MRLLPRIALTVLALALPVATFSMEQFFWDFRGGQVPLELRIGGLDKPEPTENGLHITASASDGSLIATIPGRSAADVVSMTFVSPVEIETTFLWRHANAEPGTFSQVPLTIPASAAGAPVNINLGAYGAWNGWSDTIGFALPQGSDVVLQDMQLVRWNAFEQLTEAWKSFWTIGAQNAMSINFLWGPLVTFNPVATQELFENLPPKGRSANWYFYGVLAAAGVIVAGMAASGFLRKSRAVRLFLCVFAVLWVFHDIRMGYELLSYAKHDYDSFISQPPGKRTLRTYLNFNDIMEQLQPYLPGATRLGLVTPQPVIAMTRYFALPVPVTKPDGPDTETPLWFVFQDGRAGVDASGRLTVDGVPWSAPGTILQRFDETSFLFSTRP